MTKPSDTIESREPRYGDYYERSDLKERIIEAFSESRNWMGLEPDARNSLFMIADKLSRILNGDPDDPDSWHDIGGYAGLVEGRLTTVDSVEKLRDLPYPISGTFTLSGYPIAGDSDGGKFEYDRESDHAGRSHDQSQTRCPYFTGEPPSWDDAPEWANWLTQDADGDYAWKHRKPESRLCLWLSFGMNDYAKRGQPHNPHWQLAIEPRPETHK